MSCYPSTSLTITEIDEEIYVLTHIKVGINIDCFNNYSHPINIQNHYIGSVKINLPCHCSLKIGNEVLIPKRFPCINKFSKNFKITHTIPTQLFGQISKHLFLNQL